MPKKLPANPSLEHLRNQAKALLKAHQQSLFEANSRIQGSHPEWSRSSMEQIQSADISLSDAQWVIAREYGFDSWEKLKHHVELRKRPARGDEEMHEFDSWYIDDKVEANATVYNLLRCPRCGETFLWQAARDKDDPYLCPTCFSAVHIRKRFIFWAEVERRNFKRFQELFSGFSMDELFMLYEVESRDVRDPIKEKLIEIYTEEVLTTHRKKINWPLRGTQFVEAENKLYDKARSLW